MRASTAAGDVFYQRLPFRVNKPFDISAEGYPYEGKLWVTANVAGLGEKSKGVVARSRLLQGENVVGSCETSTFTRGLGAAAIDITKLPPGKYVVKSAAIAPDGTTLGETMRTSSSSPNLRGGVRRPAANTPFPSHGRRSISPMALLGVLGRQYQTGAGSLPQQVVVNGQSILAGPITMQMKSGAAATDLARLPAAVGDSFPDSITRNAQGSVGSVKVGLKTTTEFDGTQRCDLTLGAGDIEELTLEIPIQNKSRSSCCPPPAPPPRPPK